MTDVGVSDAERAGWPGTSRTTRAIFAAALIVCMALIASCSYFVSDADPQAEATQEVRNRTCALERENINVALLAYAAKTGRPATSLDQLVDSGYLLTVIGHRLSGSEVIDSGFCVVSDLGDGGPGAPEGNEPDFQEVSELVNLANSIFVLAILGPGSDGSAYALDGPHALCFATELKQSIGKTRMQQLASNRVSTDKSELVAARDALNKCDPADTVGRILMDMAYMGLNSATSGNYKPTPDSIACAGEFVRGRVGSFALQSTIDGTSLKAADFTSLFTKCFPRETVVAIFENLIAKGGVPRSVARCAAKKSLERFGAARFLEASLNSSSHTAAGSELQSVVASAVQECM